MGENKDKVIFFYRSHDKNAKIFMDLFETLTKKLYENTNLSMLRCNLQKNDVLDLLEIGVENTPNIVFLRNKMKQLPIYFNARTMTTESVI